MLYLRQQPLQRWVRPEASPLGNHLYVIHFADQNRTQHRICGVAYPSYHVFVMCVTIVEKGGRYYPIDYEARTLECRSELLGGVHERSIASPWPRVA